MKVRAFELGRTVLLIAVLIYSANGLAQAESPTADFSVLTYHAHVNRDGNFIMPTLTWDPARSLHLNPNFHAVVSGHVYAQPLYWRPPGAAAGQLMVATENNSVHALDATTGNEIWSRSLGTPVALSSLECGNI